MATPSYSASGYQLNVAYSGGAIISANIGGAADGSDDGSISVDGNVLTVVDGPAKGLKLLFTGARSASGMQLDLSIGLGTQVYDAVDALATRRSGLIAGEIGSLEGQNELGTARIERLEERLERERERLLERFVAMETALTTMNRLLDSLRQQIDAVFGERQATKPLDIAGLRRPGRAGVARPVPRRMRESRRCQPCAGRSMPMARRARPWRRRDRSSCFTKARSGGSRRRATRSKRRRINDRCVAVARRPRSSRACKAAWITSAAARLHAIWIALLPFHLSPAAHQSRPTTPRSATS